MRLGNVYNSLLKKTVKTGRCRSRQVLFVVALLADCVAFTSAAQTSYVTSGPQSITVCGNIDSAINSYLAVTDLVGTSVTWSVAGAPSHGVLNTLPQMRVVAGSQLLPIGVSYSPDPGYSGADNFAIMADNGVNPPVVRVFNVMVNPGPTLSLTTAAVAVCRGTTTLMLPFQGQTNIGSDTSMFSYAGPISQSWTVPPGITSVYFDVQGAQGGNESHTGTDGAGKGGRVQGFLPVTPGHVLNITVGGKGGDGSASGATGGFNGGEGSTYYFYGSGGGGGGASDIRLDGTGLSDRVVVAGGGGGNGADGITAFLGGMGGGLSGGNGADNLGGLHAAGGSQISGGVGAAYSYWIPGNPGTLGLGGAGSTQGISGGGGGGYYGGGGGVWTGGGGGSSFTAAAASVEHTQGYRSGDGQVTIIYSLPGTYAITWSSAALTAGFRDTTGAALPASAFTIDIPADAAPGTYSGTIYLSNSTCTSNGINFSVTVKAVPDVAPVASQVVCNGRATTDIVFVNVTPTGSTITNQWSNDYPAIGNIPFGIGYASSGTTNHIPAFVPENSSPLPVHAHFTVTPISNGCVGAPQSFTITDNPVPVLSSTATPPQICDNTLFAYPAGSGTPGTAFAWERATVTDITSPAGSGTGSISETLHNAGLNPVSVVYTYTLTANGCSEDTTVTVTVNPTPMFTSPTTAVSICHNTPFNYTPASGTAAAVASWSRVEVAGVSNPASVGSGAISETLINTTPLPVVVNYLNILDINGCTHSETIPVTVNPLPVLSTPTTTTPRCDSTLFNYNPVSATPGTTITWARPSVFGLGNAAQSGIGAVNEYLKNSSALPVVVTYTDTLKANGCINVQNVDVTVYPSPSLSSGLPVGLCTSSLFSYTPASATPGTSFAWLRDSIQGIVNPVVAAPVPNNINEILVNVADTIVKVPYIYLLTANGCTDTQRVHVPVYPTPRLSDAVTSFSICDSTVFNFTPHSSATAAAFNWQRSYVSGIAQTTNGGVGNPNEKLVNNTYIDVNTVYVYTITANGCVGTQNVNVTVHPTPKLSSSKSATVCSGAPFAYMPTGYTPGSTFTWTRAGVSAITPAGGSGTGSISETLISSATSATNSNYIYTLSYGGCSHNENLVVKVNPAPGLPTIATSTPPNVCSSLQFANFGAAVAPASGMRYEWSATNASVWATSPDGQYALISFNNPGSAVVTLTSKISNTACTSNTNFNVEVGNTYVPPAPVLYFNGQFICQQTDVDSYQWGYDDATTFDSTVLAGETNQNFAEPAPDFTHRYYWVMFKRDGCTQKSYYKVPSGVNNITTAVSDIKVYPNPADNAINVVVNAVMEGNANVIVYNMLGQQVADVKTTDHKTRVDIAALPSGCYMVECVNDGVKIASARFIKN